MGPATYPVLLLNRRGDYKINDLSIGGISVKVTQRDEFAGWIQKTAAGSMRCSPYCGSRSRKYDRGL
jgi:hypothetical protein